MASAIASPDSVPASPTAVTAATAATAAPENQPVAPHGGSLVDRFVPADEAAAFLEHARGLVPIHLHARELADLELIATGAASPLTGFLASGDYDGVVNHLRLASGTVWPIPFTLPVPEDLVSILHPGDEASLVDDSGRIWGTIRVAEVFLRDRAHEARAVFGTEDPAHPGVAALLASSPLVAGGEVRVLPLPDDLPFATRRLTPRALREEIRKRGWARVAGFQTRNPIHRAHEHLTKLALEVTDGLVLHPLVGETKSDDVPASVRFRVYEELVARYYPKDRTILAAFPAAMRYAGPREALLHALLRKNYGIAHLIVGRDHAGVGSYYDPLAAQRIFGEFTDGDLGVSPLFFPPSFFCRVCDGYASSRTCSHDPSDRLELSGSKARQILSDGGTLPEEFTRRETAEILRAHYRDVRASGTEGQRLAHPAAKARLHEAHAAEAPARRGFILCFTGLSGAGKSTLAEAVAEEVDGEVLVEVLDGDEVRTHLSKGLSFSKEDRDTNVRRIGFVARLLARNGVGVITAAISPYDATRREVRALAESEGIPFLEVFVDAELEVLVARDVKGLYKRAIAGEIAHFTGISDPYESPSDPELTIRSDRESVTASVDRVLALLQDRGLATPRRKESVA